MAAAVVRLGHVSVGAGKFLSTRKEGEEEERLRVIDVMVGLPFITGFYAETYGFLMFLWVDESTYATTKKLTFSKGSMSQQDY